MNYTAIHKAAIRMPAGEFLRVVARRAINYLVLAIRKYFFRSRFITKKIAGFRLLMDIRDPGISTQLLVRGGREPEHAFLLRKELSPGMTALDVGANIGYYAVMLAELVGPQGKVYALEPYPPNFCLLTSNVSLNRKQRTIETFPLALGREQGIGTLYITEQSNWHTLCPETYAAFEHRSRRYRGSLQVQLSSIEVFARDKRPIDLIRMDLEGYEVEVLQGMIPMLSRRDFRPKLLLEVHPERYHDVHHSMRDVLRDLMERGRYYCKYMISDGHFNRDTRALFTALGYTESDIIAIFREADRAVYSGISDEHAMTLICDRGAAHSVLLERAA